METNEDALIDGTDELADNADAFGKTIIGIDSAAGLSQKIENEVIEHDVFRDGNRRLRPDR
ncbi:MAG: hypothetical protein L0K07_09265 [Yaniella sp.]|uniref:hypothetical protein n=1 Tax=Yaniella sp. TaxID=2773929 RepID=UPI002647A013|nr:hypothetical protein [Yaniella sp.]MDN5732090.1 hypothetical protein [Yaniella sp.]MDN5818546.1 hypothetical protein [Yaniella sp.]MDN6148954.1 hypothetical protein [Yaniella sp.]MDN6411549.1 hypothetical protein [Yaniella sp.]MDN6455800.1 hypothetical protein [Yaniella sp.]